MGRALPALEALSLFDQLDEHRQQRYADNSERPQREILFDDGHVAEQQSRADANAYPSDGAGGIEEDESMRRHLRRASDERHERAHDWHETSENQRLPAISLEEFVRALQMV